MKKTLIVLLGAMLMNIQAIAQVQGPISFSIEIIKDGPTINPHPKNPIVPPVVYLEDYTLTFEAYHPEYILYIKDENDVVVYSTVVTSTTTEVVLPSTLSGSYKIELLTSDYYFWGYILL